jgi:hypothetical protein
MSRLPQVIKEARHTSNLKSSILKQTGWAPRTLELVDFEAHKQAYHSHNRVHRISISKQIHGLYQTRKRDNQFYGSAPACPCCQVGDETLNHVFSCMSPDALDHRQRALKELQLALETTGIPAMVTQSIIYGIERWTASQHDSNISIRAPSRGSMVASRLLLTQAFTEQSSTIGWDQFLRGRVSLHWGRAISSFKSDGKPSNANSTAWIKQMILKVWDYSISLWK